VDYGALAVRAMKNKPDGYIPYTYPEAMVKITFELQKRGVKENRRFLYFHGAGTPEFWNLAQGKLDGSYIWSMINPLVANPKWKSLAKAYKEKYGTEAASWVIPADYDAIYLIKACFEDLKITGCPDKLKEERIKIRDWMNNVRNFQFAANTINIVDGEYQAPAWMFNIKNNALSEPINCGLTWK
jgi:ABC-type branched-subunit amino acid transport system substrate-binding protein